MNKWLCIFAVTPLISCDTSPPIPPLTECPRGATVVGVPPPEGVEQRCEMANGLRHGKSKSWYENGQVRAETEWWQGRKHGRFTLWYENGQKRAEGGDRHGIPHGKWTYWDKKGKVAQQKNFYGVDPLPLTSPSD